MEEFLLFAAVGFLAQAVDGALGMAYGVISSTVLLAFGVPPAQASASAHAAELFTTAASGSAHLYHRNIDWELFWRLIPFGVGGGMLGAFVLTSFDGDQVKPFVTAYLAVIGSWLLYRSFQSYPLQPRETENCGAAGRNRGVLGCRWRWRVGPRGHHRSARRGWTAAICHRHGQCERVPDCTCSVAELPRHDCNRPLGASRRIPRLPNICCRADRWGRFGGAAGGLDRQGIAGKDAPSTCRISDHAFGRLPDARTNWIALNSAFDCLF